jgi:hypothetical protein
LNQVPKGGTVAITSNYILTCDDVRREDNGKAIILGLYLPDIAVPQIPIVMPTLTFFCNLASDRPGNFRMTFRLRDEGSGRSIAEGFAALPVIDPTMPVICPIKIGNVQISSPGLYSFSLEFDGQAPIATTFNVLLVVPGAAQGPPAGQLRR